MSQLIHLDTYPVKYHLRSLLKDKTTRKNIIWATNSYSDLGAEFSAEQEIIQSVRLPKFIQPRIEKSLDHQNERTKSKGEVFTPAWICCRMNNDCDEEWFGRKDVFNVQRDTGWEMNPRKIDFNDRNWTEYIDSRRLEITCGEAPFLVSRYDATTGAAIAIPNRIGILDRKLRIVNENTTNEEDWLKWTVRAFQSVYGYEYQGDNLLIARMNLLLTFSEYLANRWQRTATDRELTTIANIISWNLWQMDGLQGTVPLGALKEEIFQYSFFEPAPAAEEANEIGSECRIYDWRSKTTRSFIGKKGAKKMKFDFCIGNPPYQDLIEDSKNKEFAPPIYNKFLDIAYEVADRVLMIHPARFLYNSGSTPKEWNLKMLNDGHLKVVYFEQDSSKVFSNTDIKGGICITYRDNTKKFGSIKVFTPFEELRTITEKVWDSAIEDLSTIIYTQNRFNLNKLFSIYPNFRSIIGNDGKDKRFRNNIFDKIDIFTDKRNSETDIAVIGVIKNKRSWRYITADVVDLAHENLMKYKVIVPRANGSGALGETLSNPCIIKRQEGYTQTFIGIGAYDSELEANNLLKYLKCKFSRTMLSVLKNTQHNEKDTWRKVPLQDFTGKSDIDWTQSIAGIDQQLYKKYNLSEDEISFIESNVKEME